MTIKIATPSNRSTVVWHGRIGPGFLGHAESAGSTNITQAEEHEGDPGRKVPTPDKQRAQEIIRTTGLRAQASDRTLRDKVVRGGGTKKTRRKETGLVQKPSITVPLWGDSNVVKNALLKEAFIKKLFKPKAPPPKPTMKDSAKAMFKGIEQGLSKGVGKVQAKVKEVMTPTPGTPAAFRAKPTPTKEEHAKAWEGFSKSPHKEVKRKAPRLSERPVSLKTLKDVQQVSGADPQQVVQMAQQHGMKPGAMSKILANPWGNILIQMGMLTAIDPMMRAAGIDSPILGGVLPLLAFSTVPGMLESAAGIPRMKAVLQRRAERGRLGQPLPGIPRPVAQPQPAPQPAMVNTASVKVASVAIPRVATVFCRAR